MYEEPLTPASAPAQHLTTPVTPAADATHPAEMRRSQRKRSQKEANIEDSTPPTSTITPLTTDKEKRRKTGAPNATSTPIPTKQTYSFNFNSRAPPQSPLIEESFQQPESPTPNINLALPLLAGDVDLDTSSDANTSLTVDSPAQTPTTSLRNRLIAAKERGNFVNINNVFTSDPIDKYTRGPMPPVYYSHPTAALDFIDIDQVGDWENLPEGKLLAHPFGHEVRSAEHHQEIKAYLFAAVIEITQSESVGICSPRPCPSQPGTPTVFLIYNISELHRQMLLKREVWSSPAFTFRVTSLDPVRPDYLFGITDLTTKSVKEVRDIVRKVWDATDTAQFLTNIVASFPDDQKTTLSQTLSNFSDSMSVTVMETKKQGGAAAPTFNVYANATLINDDGLWCLLRNHFAAQTYAPQFQDPGSARTDLHRCSICHSVEHPRGLCPFPRIEGWKGPFSDMPDPKRGDDKKFKAPKPKKGNRLPL